MKKTLLLTMFVIFSFNSYAQQKDSLKIENSRFAFGYKKLALPVGLMISGIALDADGRESLKNEVVEERNEHLLGYENHIDDYAQLAPFVALYAFEWAGMHARTDWKNRSAILIKGQIVNLGLVFLLKKTLKKTRPDGTAYSFPSGHTANAFAGATMLSIEYGEEYKWVPYAAFATAAGVGTMRMVNNKHYISDVVFGAGLGILSMKLAYWTHKYKWNKTRSEIDPFAGVLYKQAN